MKGKPERNPFQFSERTYPAGKQNFNANLIEQYKLACTAADNVSARRENSNRYLITLNTAIVALYAFHATGDANPYLLIPLAIAGTAISVLSFAIIHSHRKINQAKFKVINEIEKHLPAGIYAWEWQLLEQGRKLTRHLETSKLEGYIHLLFGTIHLVAPTIIILPRLTVGNLF